MATDVYTPALILSMAKTMNLVDVIRSAETLRQSGQIGAVEALYEAWTQANANHPLLYAALFNYSVILTDHGRVDDARAALEHAIRINPEFLPAYINLGRVYERQGAVGLGAVQWSLVLQKLETVNGQAITHKTTALNQIARTMEAASQDDTAESMLRQSLEIDPRQREVVQHFLALRQRQCKWPVIDTWDRVSRETLMNGMSPLSATGFTDDPLLQLAIAHNYNRYDVGRPEKPMRAWPQATSAPDSPLRIGYLSSDFREHAIGHLMAEVLALHDRSKVEVFAYYCGPASQDGFHRHYQATTDHWRDLPADDAAAARQIAEDGIQILVDVNGYTREARLKLVARRPAPVIVNWLGFPGTMGSPYHHFIIADDWIIPKENEIFYSEEVMRLPCYQPNNRQRIISTRQQSRSAVGLPEDAVVYCCFNGAHKITRFTFDRWLAILGGVPGSVLWLLSADEAAQKRLRDHAAARGIAPERIIFAAKLANPEHLARYVLADLFLDTTPYGAHTTSSDALWMGVPVLTLSGRSFASRVCGSLVRSAGLSELVYTDADAFVGRAIELGHDRQALAAYRERLKAGRDTCVLFDMPGLVRSLEGLYGDMWRRYRDDRLPKPDLRNLDAYLEAGITIDHEAVEAQLVPDYRDWWLNTLAPFHDFRPLEADSRFLDTPAELEKRFA